GLIIGVLPFLFHESGAKNNFKLSPYGLLVLGIIILILLSEAQGDGKAIVERTIDVYITLCFAGFLASAAMILPGISGSFILFIMGVYLTVINGLKELDIPVILTVAFRILIGLLTMSKVINCFLTHYRTATFALIIGLVIGSVFVIYPGMPTG